MIQSFRPVFDIRTAGGIEPYSQEQFNAFIFAIIVVTILIVILTALSKKKDWKRLIAIPVLISGIAIYLALDYADRRGTIQDLANGRLKVVQGCVTNFETNSGEPHSTKSSIPDETWSVQGETFGYKDWSDIPGYHRMESRNGVVHQGQYLRVSYLISPIYRRKEIMRIELGSKLCS